jgi:hypothetical protein
MLFKDKVKLDLKVDQVHLYRIGRTEMKDLSVSPLNQMQRSI